MIFLFVDLLLKLSIISKLNLIATHFLSLLKRIALEIRVKSTFKLTGLFFKQLILINLNKIVITICVLSEQFILLFTLILEIINRTIIVHLIIRQ